MVSVVIEDFQGHSFLKIKEDELNLINRIYFLRFGKKLYMLADVGDIHLGGNFRCLRYFSK